MEKELGNFATIQGLHEAHRGIEDNEKACGLFGVLLVLDNNDLYLQQGDTLLLCDIASNRQISSEKLDTQTVRFGPLDVFGRYISKSYIDENPYFLVQRIIRYD